jgi:hypothetical protein
MSRHFDTVTIHILQKNRRKCVSCVRLAAPLNIVNFTTSSTALCLFVNWGDSTCVT